MSNCHEEILPNSEFPFFKEQNWDAYTPEDHQVWSLLFERRMEELEKTVSKAYLVGADRIALTAESVPDLREINHKLEPITGWQTLPVNGFIPKGPFFDCLSKRLFPTTTIVRTMEQLEYLPEPDIFHDVFGHVPMHANKDFAEFLAAFGRLAATFDDPVCAEAFARLFWFTVEFGLILEDGEVRIYGSGLISSSGDAANALGPQCTRRPFVLDEVIEQSFEIDRFQDVLFVIESFDQIVEAVNELGSRFSPMSS